jgi:hypothetical protein
METPEHTILISIMINLVLRKPLSVTEKNVLNAFAEKSPDHRASIGAIGITRLTIDAEIRNPWGFLLI